MPLGFNGLSAALLDVVAAAWQPKTQIPAFLFVSVEVILISCPLLIIGSGVRRYFRFERWRIRAKTAPGKQTGWDQVPGSGPRPITGYSPVILFSSESGQQYDCKSCVVYFGQPELMPEDLIVYYNPEDPEDSCQIGAYGYPHAIVILFPLVLAAFFYPAWVIFTDNFAR